MKIKNSGIILISALLFLLVLTLLTLNIIQTGLLETKMSSNYKDSTSLLHKAETTLNAKEKLLTQGINPLPPEIILISNICGVTFYRILADATEDDINERLQSTYAIVGDISMCNPKPNIQTGRQSWMEVN